MFFSLFSFLCFYEQVQECASIRHFPVIMRVLPDSNVIRWLELVSVGAVSKRCSTNTAVCACNKLEQVYMLGPSSCKFTWPYVVLNKREWIWVGWVCMGSNEAWSYCYGCLQVQSNPLSVPFLFACSCMCIFFWAMAVWGGEGVEGRVSCVYLLCANQHWTSQLEKLDQTLPITRLTRDVSFHLSFTGLWNHEAEWKIQAATNHCTAGSLWRSPLLQHIAYGLHRQGRVKQRCSVHKYFISRSA